MGKFSAHIGPHLQGIPVFHPPPPRSTDALDAPCIFKVLKRTLFQGKALYLHGQTTVERPRRAKKE